MTVLHVKQSVVAIEVKWAHVQEIAKLVSERFRLEQAVRLTNFENALLLEIISDSQKPEIKARAGEYLIFHGDYVSVCNATDFERHYKDTIR